MSSDWVAPDRRTEMPGGGDGRDPARTGSTAASDGGGLAPAGVAVSRCDAAWPDEGSDESLPGGDGPLKGLEPVGVGGVLDGGFDLLRSRFGLLVGLAAAMLLPLQLLEVAGELSAGLDAELSATGINSFFDAFAAGDTSTATDWVVLVARVLVLSFLGLVAGVLVTDLLEGRRRTGERLLRAAARRWWVALLLPVLCVPVKSVGTCLVYIGFFAVDALLMCASVVAGAEGRGPLGSFARSWRLGWHSYGTALGASFGGFVISLVLQAALWIGPVLLASQFVASESTLLVIQQIGLLSMLIVQPLTACISARLYVELRCRAEGLDIELRRERVGLG